MPKIVILGGGFGGLTAALGLEKKLRGSNVSISLIDRENYHLFNSNLYEVATAAEELENITDLKKSIGLPFAKIFKGKRVHFLQGEVKAVDPLNKIVSLPGKKLEYDYLIVALGSKEEYFNIPGAKDYGIPLKNLSNALKIKNAIEFAVERHKFDAQKKYARIIIAGGGYTGVELAGELRGLVNFLSWKYQYPNQKIEIGLIEAANTLMPGMGERATNDAVRRLQELGVGVKVLSPIIKATQNTLELSTGERVVYDVLIWTAGVKAKAFPQGLDLQINERGRAEVDEFLRARGQDNIFILGDQAAVFKRNPDAWVPTQRSGQVGAGGRLVPQSAQDAIHQGRYLSYALPLLIKNRKPRVYKPKNHGFIVSVGGKWAILNNPPFYFKGRFAYFIHELAHVRYFASLLGLWKAVKLVWFQDRLYGRND